MVYSYNGILLKNKVEKKMIYLNTEINFKCIMLSENIQTQRPTYCMILFICIYIFVFCRKDKTTVTKIKSVTVGKRLMGEMITKRHEETLYPCHGGSYLDVFVKIHNTIH